MKIGLLLDTLNISYGALNYFLLEGIEKALNRFGVETEHILKVNHIVFGRKYDALIGINRVGQALVTMDGQRYVMDSFGCPYFNFILDAPYAFHESLKAHMDNLYLLFWDEGYVEYCKKYYPPCKNVEMGYMIGPVAEAVPYEERKIDILFAGSCYDYANIQRDIPTERMQNLFFWLVEQSLLKPELTMDAHVASYLGEIFQIHINDFNTIMYGVGVKAEYYLRGYYREKIMKSLVDAGFKITLVGDAWSRIFPEQPDNLTILKDTDMREAASLMADAKIVFNVMPWTKSGLHERILGAMHNGAVCVTDSSTYIEKHFQDGKNIVLYHLEELEEIPNKCRYVLEHPEEAARIAKAGMEKVKAEYTWERLVLDYILKWLM